MLNGRRKLKVEDRRLKAKGAKSRSDNDKLSDFSILFALITGNW